MDNKERIDAIAEHYRAIIELIGEDPGREGLLKTPQRAAKALMAVTQGYIQDPEAIVSQALFEHEGSRLIIVRDIEFYSLCEHHILPFYGTVTIGYIPKGKIVGLSKLARLVNVFARRLQVQERMTAEIANTLSRVLPNDGIIVTCRAQHLCMKMRGVEKQDSSTVTMEYTGRFATETALRDEFFKMI